MTSEIRDTDKSLSDVLRDAIGEMRGDAITLREIMSLMGEQGLLLLCILLTIPFLIPVSVPGVSTVFGAAIILMSIAITLNRMPWLPRRILDRPLKVEKLVPALQKGIGIVGRSDRFVRPRLQILTDGSAMSRLNSLVLVFGGGLLIMPFGFIPFSNTAPALAILFVSLGILQRDGLCVILGYVSAVATVAYFSVLLFAAGWGLSSIIGG